MLIRRPRTGWGVPMATDIAFALAVLAVAGSHLPTALRVFLLTLAVVDDLGAITVIAVFYTDVFDAWPLVLAVGVFVVVVVAAAPPGAAPGGSMRPLAFIAWTLVHASGIHATVAGVVLGLLMRVRPDPDEPRSPAEHVEHQLRPVSAGIAVPIFAFFAAGAPLSIAALQAMRHDPAAVGVIVGLFVGKFVGVFGGSWLTARFTRAELNEDLAWADMAGLAFLSGIGFTVSLLIAELAFPDQPARLDAVKEAVLVGSVLSAAVAVVILRLRGWRASPDSPGGGPIRHAGGWPSRAEEALMVNGQPKATIGELVAGMAQDVSSLVRNEIELAKSEIAESAKRGAAGAGLIAAGVGAVADDVAAAHVHRGLRAVREHQPRRCGPAS